jgi:hypothetical protein
MRRQDNGAGAGFFFLIGLVLSMIWLIQALILRDASATKIQGFLGLTLV